MTTRKSFLGQVRQAVQAGNRTGQASALPERGQIGYQGAGSDAVSYFCEQFRAAGGQVHLEGDATAAAARVRDLVQTRALRRILLGRGPLLDRLDLAEVLRSVAADVVSVDQFTEETCREPFFAADLGISEADYLIAESGTIVLRVRQQEPRSLSLLPPVHIALARRDQVLPDLFDLFERGLQSSGETLPSCVTLITGPSKTGDIELRLVTGVHGPGEVHVILVGN